MMKTLIIILLFPILCFSQDFCSEYHSLSSDSLSLIEKVQISRDLKRKMDFKFSELSLDAFFVEKSRNKKLAALIGAGKIRPRDHGERYLEALDIYIKSKLLVILFSRGDLELLRTIKVHNGYEDKIYPYLQYEIIKAGGKWDRPWSGLQIVTPSEEMIMNIKHQF